MRFLLGFLFAALLYGQADRPAPNAAAVSAMTAASAPIPSGRRIVGVITVAGRRERIQFAGHLVKALQAAGWSVRRAAVDLPEPSWDEDGIILISHSQLNAPDLEGLRSVLVAGGLSPKQQNVGAPISAGVFLGNISTDIPVLFVGARVSMEKP